MTSPRHESLSPGSLDNKKCWTITSYMFQTAHTCFITKDRTWWNRTTKFNACMLAHGYWPVHQSWAGPGWWHLLAPSCRTAASEIPLQRDNQPFKQMKQYHFLWFVTFFFCLAAVWTDEIIIIFMDQALSCALHRHSLKRSKVSQCLTESATFYVSVCGTDRQQSIFFTHHMFVSWLNIIQLASNTIKTGKF